MRLDRQPDARHPCDAARMPGDRDANFLSRDEAACALDSGYRAAIDANAGDFALLDDVDAARVRCARIAPGDRVVPHRTPAWLQQPTQDREARILRAVEIGNPLRDLLAR